jgi:hypothetical protein
MVRAGCVVFTPRSGGQVEIIGHEDRLLFETDEEAVEKIAHVLGRPGEQKMLREYLATRQELFSTERFKREIAEIVRGFVFAEGNQG